MTRDSHRSASRAGGLLTTTTPKIDICTKSLNFTSLTIVYVRFGELIRRIYLFYSHDILLAYNSLTLSIVTTPFKLIHKTSSSPGLLGTVGDPSSGSQTLTAQLLPQILHLCLFHFEASGDKCVRPPLPPA